MYWIPTFIFFAHIIEEYSRFPEWATRHFGATSRAWYTYSHIPLVMLVVTISAWAQHASTATAAPMLATSVQWTFATNALFHIITTFAFREYSPGLTTAVGLFLPATAYMFLRTVREELLTTGQLVAAIALGSVVGIAVIASLWLHMDYDWRMRRRARAPV